MKIAVNKEFHYTIEELNHYDQGKKVEVLHLSIPYDTVKPVTEAGKFIFIYIKYSCCAFEHCVPSLANLNPAIA